ncbi:MAG: N-acetyltransferase [Thermaceae bacterium]|nr:N-acetyltransferase [Thermaceae bacterium]
MTNLNLLNNPLAERYEARLADKVVAFAEYRRVTGAIMFTHTQVDQNLEGQGVASQLIRFALDEVRSQNLLVIPMCPFVVAFIQRHPAEYLSLVNPQHRGIFGL